MPRHTRSPRTTQVTSMSQTLVTEYIAELAAQGDLSALSALQDTVRQAWMAAWENSPQRNIPLESEMRQAMSGIPEERQTVLRSVLERLFIEGKVRYKRTGDAWFVIDGVIGRTKPLRRWVYDFLLGMAGLGYNVA